MDNWISCSEKLPEKDGEYLATFVDGKYRFVGIKGYAFDLFTIDEYEFADKKGVSGWYDYDPDYGHYVWNDVIAWMPLPELYKGD